MSKPKVNIGVIGIGRAGWLHAEHLAYQIPEVRLVAVADVDENKVKKCVEHLGVDGTMDYHALLNRPDIDAVVISTPSNLHAQMIVEAAAARKHIFCEKPIDLQLDRVNHALAAVHKADVKLQMGYNRRFDANFSRVRQAISKGEIGIPHVIHITSREPLPPSIHYLQHSGGMFMDMTVHDFDMARFLIGSEIESVYTVGGAMLNPASDRAEDIDTAIITIQFKNGVIGSIDNCRKSIYGFDQRVEVFGGKGSIRTKNNFPNSVTFTTEHLVGQDLPLSSFVDRYADSFRMELKVFANALLNNAPTPVTGEDARTALILAQAAKISYEKKRPIPVEYTA